MYVYKELKSYVDDEGFTFFDLKKTYTDDRLSEIHGLNIKDAKHQFNDANSFWLDVDQLHAKKKKSTEGDRWDRYWIDTGSMEICYLICPTGKRFLYEIVKTSNQLRYSKSGESITRYR